MRGPGTALLFVAGFLLVAGLGVWKARAVVDDPCRSINGSQIFFLCIGKTDDPRRG